MNPEQLEDLVRKYIEGSYTEEERELLVAWFRSEQNKVKDWEASSLDEENLIKEEMFNIINQRIDKPERRLVNLWPQFAAAASVIILISTGIYFFSPKKTDQNYRSNVARHDALPGTNGAILTLASGKQIVLGRNTSANINIQPNNRIKTYNDSLLIYTKVPEDQSSQISYNTLTTPKGRQYRVVLPDGTKVWLNAASTLQYPTVFAGKERTVKLTGEAYFEVRHNADMPFKVAVNNQIIEDIGTEFNINSYNDESSTIVTLVAGSAKVQQNNHVEILKPGEQASMNALKNYIQVETADEESALAWKNGLFHFNHAKLEVALKQISRWYDLEIQYEGPVPEKTIDGEIYRDVKASQLFTILNQLNVKFKIDGNKLIVINK